MAQGIDPADTTWMLISTALVLIMSAPLRLRVASAPISMRFSVSRFRFPGRRHILAGVAWRPSRFKRAIGSLPA